jgi:hypothetical protein
MDELIIEWYLRDVILQFAHGSLAVFEIHIRPNLCVLLDNDKDLYTHALSCVATTIVHHDWLYGNANVRSMFVFLCANAKSNKAIAIQAMACQYCPYADPRVWSWLVHNLIKQFPVGDRAGAIQASRILSESRGNFVIWHALPPLADKQAVATFVCEAATRMANQGLQFCHVLPQMCSLLSDDRELWTHALCCTVSIFPETGLDGLTAMRDMMSYLCASKNTDKMEAVQWAALLRTSYCCMESWCYIVWVIFKNIPTTFRSIAVDTCVHFAQLSGNQAVYQALIRCGLAQ